MTQIVRNIDVENYDYPQTWYEQQHQAMEIVQLRHKEIFTIQAQRRRAKALKDPGRLKITTMGPIA